MNKPSYHRTSSLWTTGAAVLFGTRLGLVIYLTTLCIFGALLRADFLITDSYTLANGLYSLSNGKFVLTEAVFGPDLQTPGAERVNGDIIARNYGAIVLSLPFWVILTGLNEVADLAVALVGVWSLVVLLLAVEVSLLLNTRRVMMVSGVAVLLLFVMNIAFVEPINSQMTYLLALQFFHAAIAAFVPVFLYRLFSRLETTRVGVMIAVLSVLGTPLTVWGMYPKRHALTVAIVVTIAYALYRSRSEPDGMLITDPVVFRALAYVLVGLYAWIHAPEALVILVVLAAVDIPTAPNNSPRNLMMIGISFFISLIPFLLTNALVVGDPLKPPRLIARSGVLSSSEIGGTGTEGGQGGLLQLIQPAVKPLLILQDLLADGFQVFLKQPDQIYHTIIRSGAAEGVLDASGQESANLTILESAPVLAALLAVVPAIRGRIQTPVTVQRVLSGPRVVDAFAVVLCIALMALYATRLPIHAQITVRYLFPVYPLGVYLLFRLPQVRTTLTEQWQIFLWTLGAVVLIGTQLHVVIFYYFIGSIGEGFQFYALLALTVASFLGVWALISHNLRYGTSLGAVLLGTATGVAFQLALLIAVIYGTLGDSHILPLMRIVAEVLSTVT